MQSAKIVVDKLAVSSETDYVSIEYCSEMGIGAAISNVHTALLRKTRKKKLYERWNRSILIAFEKWRRDIAVTREAQPAIYLYF